MSIELLLAGRQLGDQQSLRDNGRVSNKLRVRERSFSESAGKSFAARKKDEPRV